MCIRDRDIDLYLRIAPETYLKRAIIGGFTKVFEIARCFRNEGMDTSHLQDFTMIEGYGAYLNYKDNMIFLREMLQTIIEKLFGTLIVHVGDKMVDLSGEWPTVSFRELILQYAKDVYKRQMLYKSNILFDNLAFLKEKILKDPQLLVKLQEDVANFDAIGL